MSRSDVNPRALEEFARRLKKHTESIRLRTSLTRKKAADLAAIWQDARYEKFLEVFEIGLKDLEDFLEQADRQRKFMEEKARRGMKYLRL